MRAEKVFGYVGLGFFFLFPLVSLLQLRDTDDTWRQVAERVRPVIVSLHANAGLVSDPATAPPPVACGVVLDRERLRIAVAGRAPAQVASLMPGGWVSWQTVYEDAAGDFAILQASPGNGEASTTAESGNASVSGLQAARDAGVRLASNDSGDDISAALVGPAQLADMPIWVGVLTSAAGRSGRRTYHTDLLRPVLRAETVSTAQAAGDIEADLAPVLAGAPFVSRDGEIVALYAGRRDGAAEAVPIGPIREALAALDRQASAQ